MCDNMTIDERMPTCPCGGEILLEDNSEEAGEDGALLIWGVCQSCGRVGQAFACADDAFEDALNWPALA